MQSVAVNALPSTSSPLTVSGTVDVTYSTVDVGSFIGSVSFEWAILASQ